MVDYDALVGLFAGLGIALLIASVISIILYIVTSLSMMRIAQKKGVENAWLAWIPVGNLYILGRITGPFRFVTDIEKPEIVLPILAGATLVAGFVPFLGTIVSLALVVLTFATYYFFYEQYRGDRAVIMLILTIVFGGIAVPIYFYSINKQMEQQM